VKFQPKSHLSKVQVCANEWKVDRKNVIHRQPKQPVKNLW